MYSIDSLDIACDPDFLNKNTPRPSWHARRRPIMRSEFLKAELELVSCPKE